MSLQEPQLTEMQPEKDAEGFSVPPSAIDAITEAEREAGLYGDPARLMYLPTDLDTAPKARVTPHLSSNLTSETPLSKKKERMRMPPRLTWSTPYAR